MATRKYNFLNRLVNKITRSSCSNNTEFCYYGHLVVLTSGTVDYMSVSIYNNTSRYSGMLADFSFDYWTYELCFTDVMSDNVEDIIVQAFRNIYGYKRVKVLEE